MLEEIHRATMIDPRASALYAPLVRPGEKLAVVVWDSYTVDIQKPGNHRESRATFSSNIKGHCFLRMEGSDLEGRPVFKLCPSASTSPRATDESISYFTLEMEAVIGQRGGFRDMLIGQPGNCMVHLLDNGYRYVIYFSSYVKYL